VRKRAIACAVGLLCSLGLTPAGTAQTPDAQANWPETEREIAVREAKDVARLHQLLHQHEAEEAAAQASLPKEQQLARRQQEEVESLTPVTFSPDLVHLSGAQGSTALSQITQRLADPRLPESRRAIAPLCSIKTRLLGSLISSETRSLKAVGKYHYVARVRLQPGDTTLEIGNRRWELQLARDTSAGDYLVTYYQPGGNRSELHVFSVQELLADKDHPIPAWLPQELDLAPNAG